MQSSCLSDCDRDTDNGVSVCRDKIPNVRLTPRLHPLSLPHREANKNNKKTGQVENAVAQLHNNAQHFAQRCRNTLLCGFVIFCDITSG